MIKRNNKRWLATFIGIGIVIIVGMHFKASKASNGGSKLFNAQSVQNLPQAAQEVLDFVLTNHSNPISTLVEATLGYSSWIGSNSFPGVIQVSSAPHGASNINWTIKDLTGLYYGKKNEIIDFRFKISQNGDYIAFENKAANDVMYKFLGQY